MAETSAVKHVPERNVKGNKFEYYSQRGCPRDIVLSTFSRWK